VTRDPEFQVLRKSRRLVTAQIAVVITIVVTAVGALAYCVMVRGQHTDMNRTLDFALSRDTVTNPPGCVWLFEQTGSMTKASPGAPTGLPIRGPIDAVSRRHSAITGSYTANGNSYEARTIRRGDTVVQAVLDKRFQNEDKRRLLIALGIAEAIGLLAAGLTGGVLARRAIAPLGEALSRQRRFVADASHELRTPLTQLHTRAQLLDRQLREDGGPPEVAAEVAAMLANTRQFGAVVEDLLLSAQLRSAPREFGTVDLAALAAGAVTAEEARARAAGIALQQEIRPCVVRGVESALRRVVVALIDNALGHSRAGGRVRVSLSTVDGRALLAVSDDGVGFDQRDAGRLFDRFARGDNGAGRRFGLGLALVREVVESHGGQVTATGELGVGASFTVSLPATVVEPAARVLAVVADGVGSGGQRGAGR
jgi:signal transduction histidine kinase